jgi:dCTP deaminase
MVLSDREIRVILGRGAARITPTPPLESFSSMAVDLTLAPELRVWNPPAESALAKVRPGAVNFSVTQVLEQLTQPLRIAPQGYELLPRRFVLGWTVERIQLPHRSRLAARVEGKSSLARLGLGIHVTAPTIHAGFGYKEEDSDYEGTALQLEIWNVGTLSILLDPGIPICQLIFEWVDGTPEQGYHGLFRAQGPASPPAPPTTPAPAPRKRRRR